MAMHNLGRRWVWSRPVAVAAAILSTIALLGVMQVSADDRIVVAFAAPVILCWSMLARAGSEGLLASPPLVFAGEVSFALYLAHMPILVVWKGLFSEWKGIDSGYAMGIPTLFCLFALTAVVAVALHLLIERPGRNWIRKRFDVSGTRASSAHPRSSPVLRDAV